MQITFGRILFEFWHDSDRGLDVFAFWIIQEIQDQYFMQQNHDLYYCFLISIHIYIAEFRSTV